MHNILYAIDTETTGLDVYKGARPFLFLGYNGTDYIASREPSSIKDICEDENIIKIFHNAKFDIKMLAKVGITVKGIFYDTMIAAHLLDENRTSQGLKPLARELLNEETNEEEVLNAWFKDQGVLKADRRYDSLPYPLLIEYGKKDVLYTYKLWKLFEPMLVEQGLLDLFLHECKLVSVLIAMEDRGVLIDKEATLALSIDLQKRVAEIQREITNMYGPTFNYNSGKQLGEIIHRDGVNVSYTDKGRIQTDATSLGKYDHPLSKLVVEMRKKEKLRKTYCEGLIEAMDANNVVHCEYRQIGTVTGRFSSAHPNLQNIPRPDEGKSDEAKRIRSLFIVRPGYTNYYFDYSQIEYRIAADYSNDEELIAKINAGEDVHTIQAQRIFKKEEVTKHERTIAKTVNFGILYGMGVSALSDSLAIPEEEALSIFTNFMNANPNIKLLRQEINKAIYKKGYIFNRFKRRRRLKASDTYKALNSLCQGLAADIIKQAMVRIYALLQGTKSSLIMNVHDELCIEIYEREEYLLPAIKEAMENFGDMFKVLILVDSASSTTTWADKE